MAYCFISFVRKFAACASCGIWAAMLTACNSSSNFHPDDTDSDSETDTMNDSDSLCGQILEATFRDFTEEHPDFQRESEGWGPVRGLIKDYLTEDRKPIFNLLRGECKLYENGTCPSTATWSSTPMWGVLVDGEWEVEDSFFTWYHNDDEIALELPGYPEDQEINRTVVKEIYLEPNPSAPNSYIFDSNRFFPLSINEGFGESPVGSKENYLFTTEIHTEFHYVENQIFTFRGDDDLWIFVNGRLALDLGGLHIPFEGTIDFDAIASELEIEPGKRYAMDIFHAERHLDESNFRIETNISCFIPVVVE